MAKQTKTQPRRKSLMYERPPGLQITVGWQRDGGVYVLDDWHMDDLRKAFPDARVIEDGMLLGYNETRDYERFHKPLYEQIAQMLTGLTPEQIGKMGGIRIYDPQAEKILWDWHPNKTNS